MRNIKNINIPPVFFLLSIVFAALFVLLLSLHPVDAIYLGTCEGYISNMSGSMVSGATVTVNVQGCSGDGCSASTTSDSNGYYVVANLNLPAGGTVSVTATKDSASGSSTGTADSNQAAYVNITLCVPPSSPTLTLKPNDTHDINQTFTFGWTSGSDSNGFPIHDVFTIGPNVTNATSPINISGSNISYGTHNWNVKTCNAGCCSDPSSDSFSIYNNAPSAPNLTFVNNTCTSPVTFTWHSVSVDGDGDACYDQFKLDGNISNETSPVERSFDSIEQHTWAVRTCDSLSCSDWSTDSFIFCKCQTTAATTTTTVTKRVGGGGGVLYKKQGYELSIQAPSYVYISNSSKSYFFVYVSFKSFVDRNFSISLNNETYNNLLENIEPNITFSKIKSDQELKFKFRISLSKSSSISNSILPIRLLKPLDFNLTINDPNKNEMITRDLKINIKQTSLVTQEKKFYIMFFILFVLLGSYLLYMILKSIIYSVKFNSKFGKKIR